MEIQTGAEEIQHAVSGKDSYFHYCRRSCEVGQHDTKRFTMSIWHKADDFDIDHVAQEVDFLLDSDYQGNVYLSVSFDQIKCIYERILEKEKSGPA